MPRGRSQSDASAASAPSPDPGEQIDEDALRATVREYLSKLKKGDLYMQGLDKSHFEVLLDEDGQPPPPSAKKHTFNRLLKHVAAALVESENLKGDAGKERKKYWMHELHERHDLWVDEIVHFDERQAKSEPDRKKYATSLQDTTHDDEDMMDTKDEEAGGEDAELMDVAEGDTKDEKDKKNEYRRETEEMVIEDDKDATKPEQTSEQPAAEAKDKTSKKRRKSDPMRQPLKKRLKGVEEVVEGEDADESVAADEIVNESREDRVLSFRKEFEEEKARIMSAIPEDTKKYFGQIGFAQWTKKDWLPVLFLGPYDVAPGEVRDTFMTMFENTSKRRDKMSRIVYWYGTLRDKYHEAFGFVAKSKCVSFEEGTKKGYHKLPNRIENKQKGGKKLTKNEEFAIRSLKDLDEDLEKSPEERIRTRVIPFKEDHELLATGEIKFLDEAEDEKKVSRTKKKQRKTDKGPKNKSTEKKSSKKARSVHESIEEELNFVEDEVTSEEEDEEVELPESESSEEEYKPGQQKKQKKPKVQKRSQPEKQRGKKAQIDRTRTAKPSKSKQAESERRRKSAAYDREQKRFEECESKFLPLIERWRHSVEKEDVGLVLQIMEEVEGCVETFSAPFIEEYGLPDLMKKRTKPLLKTDKAHRAKFKEVFNKMKRTYLGENEQVPERFKAIKRSKRVHPRTPAHDLSPTKKETMYVPERQSALSPLKSSDGAKKEADDNKSTSGMVESQTLVSPLKETLSSQTLVSPLKETLSRDSSQIVVPLSRESSQSLPLSRESSQGLPLSGELSQGQVRSTAAPAPAAKAERKAFSLSTLMRPKAPESRDKKKPSLVSDKAPLASKKAPSWLTTPPEMVTSMPTNEDRKFALEFLEAAAAQFPAEKVNVQAFAAAVEAAVFKWSEERHRSLWVEPYWERVHALVAAICGKWKTGPIVDQILRGEFPTPRDLAMVSDDVLRCSFEG